MLDFYVGSLCYRRNHWALGVVMNLNSSQVQSFCVFWSPSTECSFV